MRTPTFILASMLSCHAFAQTAEQELLIRKAAQLHIVASQVQYCKDELLKLGAPKEAPMFLDQRDPEEAKKRFSANSLTTKEKLAFSEFTSYCVPIQENYTRLTKELGIAP